MMRQRQTVKVCGQVRNIRNWVFSMFSCIKTLSQARAVDMWVQLKDVERIERCLKVVSTSVLYIQASVFWGTCRNKGMSELCSNYVRFDVLIWETVVYDDFLCNYWRFSWCFRTIPNYSELFRTKFELYFFGAVLPPNGSERFKCIEKTCIKKSCFLMLNSALQTFKYIYIYLC